MSGNVTADRIISETPSAICVEIYGDEHWLPKSQIRYEGQPGDTNCEITVPEWLLEEKGIV